MYNSANKLHSTRLKNKSMAVVCDDVRLLVFTVCATLWLTHGAIKECLVTMSLVGRNRSCLQYSLTLGSFYKITNSNPKPNSCSCFSLLVCCRRAKVRRQRNETSILWRICSLSTFHTSCILYLHSVFTVGYLIVTSCVFS